MKQVCKTSKNTKNVCIFVKFLHGTMRDTLLPLLTTFQTDFRIRICNLIGCQEEGKLVQPMRLQIRNTNLQSHWLSGRRQTCTANEIANSYSWVVKSGKSVSRIVPCKNLTNIQTFFVFLLVLQTCFTS